MFRSALPMFGFAQTNEPRKLKYRKCRFSQQLWALEKKKKETNTFSSTLSLNFSSLVFWEDLYRTFLLQTLLFFEDSYLIISLQQPSVLQDTLSQHISSFIFSIFVLTFFPFSGLSKFYISLPRSTGFLMRQLFFFFWIVISLHCCVSFSCTEKLMSNISICIFISSLF